MNSMIFIAYRPSPMMYFFVALVVIWLLVTFSQRYRSLRLAGLANELNLRLFSRDPLGLPERYDHMYLFRQGHARRARNVMIGHYQGHQLRMFDYVYETGLGRNRRTRHFSVVMVQVGRELPGLLVEPSAGAKREYNLSGMEQVELSGVSEEQGYAVFSRRAEFARGCVNEEMLVGLGGCARASLEVQDGVLALYARGKLRVGGYRELRSLASTLTESFGKTND